MPAKTRPASFVDLLLGRSTRSFLAAAAIALTLSPAKATEIGTIISFTTPRVGCTNFADAQEATRLVTLYGPFGAEDFARSMGDYMSDRWCTIFNRPSDEWKIVNKAKAQYTGPNHSYFCVESTRNYVVSSPSAESQSKPLTLPCFWVFLSEKPR
jgi:hypothetical protein